MNKSVRHFYEFGNFRVDETERRLLCEGELLPLPPKVFDTLLVLVQNSGHILSRDELMKNVWADTFVEDNNLTQYVSTLRKTLNDPGEQFIETVPRRGYRFAPVVREIQEEKGDIIVEHLTRQNLRIAEETVEKTGLNLLSRRFRFIAVAVVLAVFGISLAWMWNQTRKNEANNLSLIQNTDGSEGFELYRRGRALWQTRSGENLHEATILLEQAVQKDPNLAPAHSALADAYAFDYRNWQKAEAQAREAIWLDANSGEPHATIGFVRMFWEWKLKEAESEFNQAVKLSPNYATAHQWYAINLWATGSAGSAAFVEMKKALELEPNSVSINADMCQTLYFLRRFDEAIGQCKKTLEIDGKSFNAYSYLYEIYTAKGMETEAVEAYFKTEELRNMPLPPEKQNQIREAYRTGGIRAFWLARIEHLPHYAMPNHYTVAQHYARLGDKTQTFKHLRKAFETRDFEFIIFLADPVFDEIRFDSQYSELKDLLLK